MREIHARLRSGLDHGADGWRDHQLPVLAFHHPTLCFGVEATKVKIGGFEGSDHHRKPVMGVDFHVQISDFSHVGLPV